MCVYMYILMCVCLYVQGFTPGARELFKQENHLALYQLPSGEKTNEFTSRRLHHFTKRQPPISHLISLFVRDSSSSEFISYLFFKYCVKAFLLLHNRH